MKKLSLLLALALMLTMVSGLSVQAVAEGDIIEVTYLSCWNGGGGSWPEDQVNNPVMKKVTEATGVVLKMESLVTSELERLNTMFASGIMPDLVNAPFWSTTGGEGKVIKDAAAQGMLYDLTDVIDKYPNVARLMEVGVAMDFKEYDLFHPEFNGRMYLIPQQTPSDSPLDITNWCYATYARGDILEALGVDPKSITSAEALFELAKQIRDGGFTDAVGGSVIPMGTWHNGWSYGDFLTSFNKGYFISDWRKDSDGKVYNYIMDDKYEKQIEYMRSLISEGLLDVECFSNTDTMAKEKFATGKIAIFGAQDMIGSLREVLYNNNPEMEYTLLGPMVNQEGNIVTQVEKKGRSGFPIMFLPANISEEKADAVLRVLDYLNSDEGRMVAKYGIEGEHYTLNADGIPIANPELKAAWDEDPTVKNNLGIDNFGTGLIGAYDYDSRFPVPADQKSYWDLKHDENKAALPIVQVDKISVNYLTRDYAALADYTDASSTLNFEDELKRAYFAASDEEAMQILTDIRARFMDAGLDKLTAYVQEKVDAYAEPDKLGF